METLCKERRGPWKLITFNFLSQNCKVGRLILYRFWSRHHLDTKKVNNVFSKELNREVRGRKTWSETKLGEYKTWQQAPFSREANHEIIEPNKTESLTWALNKLNILVAKKKSVAPKDPGRLTPGTVPKIISVVTREQNWYKENLDRPQSSGWASCVKALTQNYPDWSHK